MKRSYWLLLLLSLTAVAQKTAQKATNLQVKVEQGILEGLLLESGVQSFRGIPYAAPPVGGLRWKEPQQSQKWKGVRKAWSFGNKPMQKPVYSDMNFRALNMSEDCLYLNVWRPALPDNEKLPVLVYIHGGGFIAGDGSEYRYDGESFAKKGIITITINYRLGIFGFFAHPDLISESPNRSAGNYGLLDQNAALVWVKNNIAAFGGDPDKITIAGESAGSISVSAHMASPLSKYLIAGAIGQSGAMIKPTQAPVPIEEAVFNGKAFAEKIKAGGLAGLRSIDAVQLLEEASRPGSFTTKATIDGYFLTQSPLEVFRAGKQSNVTLLTGWTSAELPYMAFMGGDYPDVSSYNKKVTEMFGKKSDEALKMYPGNTQEVVIASATALASDRFIVYSTWKWAELHRQVLRQPTYVYIFSKERPVIQDGEKEDLLVPAKLTGAGHASDIEYALGNLATNKVYKWTQEDYDTSQQMQDYLINFIKTGNPNGTGLPPWPESRAGAGMNILNIDVESKAVNEEHRERYLFLDEFYNGVKQ